MSFNFLDVLKYTIFRRISNVIINKAIGKTITHGTSDSRDLINQGYTIPNVWDIIKTLLFYGWIMNVPYILVSFILIAAHWLIAEYIFTTLYFILLLLQFFTIRLAYKKGDKKSTITMPKKGIVVGFITNTIVIGYFLILGLPAAQGIYSFYQKDIETGRVKKVNNVNTQAGDSIAQKKPGQ